MPSVALQIIEELTKDFKTIGSSGGKWWVRVDKSIKLIVLYVQKFKEKAEGKDKKTLAMDLIMEVWEKYLNLKKIPDIVERPLVKFLASRAIETWVIYYKKEGILSEINGEQSIEAVHQEILKKLKISPG